MHTPERMNMVAPCGIDCAICELHICKDNPKLYSILIEKGIPKEKIPCKGCRNIAGNCPVKTEKCLTFLCINEKQVEYCYECSEFPCLKLHPAADRANILPHNLKVFNLCTIKHKGQDYFIQNSLEIKKRYYNGKMEVGKGPMI